MRLKHSTRKGLSLVHQCQYSILRAQHRDSEKKHSYTTDTAIYRSQASKPPGATLLAVIPETETAQSKVTLPLRRSVIAKAAANCISYDTSIRLPIPTPDTSFLPPTHTGTRRQDFVGCAEEKS